MTQLFDAALNGDLIELKHLLKKGACINAPDDSGFLPLHIAIRNDQFEVAKLLLENGSSSEDNNNDDFMSPLQLGYVVGNEDMIQLLWRYSEELIEPPPPVSPPAASASAQFSSPVQLGSASEPPGSPPPAPLSPFSPSRPKLPSGGGVDRLEPAAEHHTVWDKVPRGHWEFWKLQCEEETEQATVSLQLQVGRAHPGLELFLRHIKAPSIDDYDFHSKEPDKFGQHSITMDNPAAGEWVVGVTSAPGELYRGPISLNVCFGSSKAPEWISDLYAQCDGDKRGYIEQDELLMFCQFANPKVKEDTVRGSLEGYENRMDSVAFERWAKENEGIINPDVNAPAASFCPGSPLGSSQGLSSPTSQAQNSTPTGMGSISRICMNLPCMSISDTVLTPVKGGR